MDVKQQHGLSLAKLLLIVKNYFSFNPQVYRCRDFPYELQEFAEDKDMKTQIMSDDTAAQPSVGELVEVLRDELVAHHKLIQLEMTKQEAIIARSGQKLKDAAGEQAKELHKIDLLESRRDKLARQILHTHKDLRLSQIIESEAVSAPEKTELTRYETALKAALGELKRLSELNARMLIDSRDLFKTMLTSLAAKHPGRDAGSRPVLVDANC
jgi:hypothetical protein